MTSADDLVQPPDSAKACSRKKGSAVVDVVIGTAIVIFIILPIFSFVAEKFILLDKAQMIRDAVDMTNISAYNALLAGNLGKVQVSLSQSETEDIFRNLLAANLNLNPDLSPKSMSLAEGRVTIDSLEIYTSGFPLHCPNGVEITRPAVHSSVNIPVKPSLYRRVILELLGRDNIDLKVHVDSDIPVNN
jgi:hypothetical protein